MHRVYTLVVLVVMVSTVTAWGGWPSRADLPSSEFGVEQCSECLPIAEGKGNGSERPVYPPKISGFTFRRFEDFGNGPVAIYSLRRFSIRGVQPGSPVREFVLLPFGKFTLGGEMTVDAETFLSSAPSKNVSVGPFLIARTPVVQSIWRHVMGENPSRYTDDQIDGSSDFHPVESFSEEELHEFLSITRLALPTEAEWEYACRAGTATNLFFPGSIDERIQHYGWVWHGGAGTTQTVALKHSNPFGLFDLYGNVWELCADHPTSGFGDHSPYGLPYRSDEQSDANVVRGGSFTTPWNSIRSTLRKRYSFTEDESWRSQVGIRPVFRLQLVPKR